MTNKVPGRLARLRAWAKAVKRDVVALWLAARDPRTPWYVKLLAGLVAAYALSPIDLIPDFVPVLGYLDDLVIVPLGIIAVVALMPADLMHELRLKADTVAARPRSRVASVLFALIWITAAAALAWLAWRWFRATGSI